MTGALHLLERVPSILIFLTALTVVSECCSIAGVFDHTAASIVRLSRGRASLTWGLLMVLSSIVTAFLSLDTTAVLMTSAAVAVAHRLGRPVRAFAFPTLWIANMASMWLPVSNLTTLLARDVLPHPDSWSYLKASWPVALATTLTPLAIAAVMFRRDLVGVSSVVADGLTAPKDSGGPHNEVVRREVTFVVVAMSVCLLFLEPAIPASIAAVVSASIVVLRLPERKRDIHLPWSSLGITTALFGTVAVLQGTGLLHGVTTSLRAAPEWQLAAASGLGANVMNNLPAYLAFEPAAHGQPHRILALLVGVNVLSGLTWWGSVATLLWRDRLRRLGTEVRLRDHLARTGLATAITATVALSVLALTM